jgi:hemerythrin-like domain-containing protein
MLSQLMELHAELDDVFLLHQEALVERKFELARELLAVYRRLLLTHIRHEEEQILPIFERAGPVPRWPVVLYTGQHQKLLALLDRVEARLETLASRRDAIALISFEATYKHLLEHHDGAEREGLYPVVDRTASAEEQTQVLESCLNEWRRGMERERSLLDRARRDLGAG